MLLLLLGGCGQLAATDATSSGTGTLQPAEQTSAAAEVAMPLESVTDVSFPKQASVDGPRVVMEAFVVGPLSEEDRCLRVRDRNGETSYLIVWPPGVQLRRTGDGLALINDAEQVLVQVGETIRISGGALPTATEVESRQPLSQPLPSSCPGPYWVVGEEIGRSSE